MAPAVSSFRIPAMPPGEPLGRILVNPSASSSVPSQGQETEDYLAPRKNMIMRESPSRQNDLLIATISLLLAGLLRLLYARPSGADISPTTRCSWSPFPQDPATFIFCRKPHSNAFCAA
jgi:hypothetical protein